MFIKVPPPTVGAFDRGGGFIGAIRGASLKLEIKSNVDIERHISNTTMEKTQEKESDIYLPLSILGIYVNLFRRNFDQNQLINLKLLCRPKLWYIYNKEMELSFSQKERTLKFSGVIAAGFIQFPARLMVNYHGKNGGCSETINEDIRY